MAPFCSLLLASLSMAVLGTEAQACGDAVQWKQVFVLNVAADNFTHSFFSDSKHDCLRACSRMTGREMFGYQPGGGRCLLYNRTVDNSTGGAAAPDTRYWSTGCPISRKYELRSGVCFKWVTTQMNWTAARDHCREEGGDLYVADSASKIAVLEQYQYLGWYFLSWVGATSDEETWRWLNGNPVTQNVSTGCSPNGTCLLLSSNTVYSCTCDFATYFSCEIAL